MNASYRLLLFGTIPLGAFLGGALGDMFGLRTGLELGVAGLALPIAWLLFSPVFALAAIPDCPLPGAAQPARSAEPKTITTPVRRPIEAGGPQGREGTA